MSIDGGISHQPQVLAVGAFLPPFFHGAALLVVPLPFTQSRKQRCVALIATVGSSELSAYGNSGLNCIFPSLPPRGGSADRQPLAITKHLYPSQCQHPQVELCVAVCLGWQSSSWEQGRRSPLFPLQPPQVCEHGSCGCRHPLVLHVFRLTSVSGFVISIWKASLAKKQNLFLLLCWCLDSHQTNEEQDTTT